MRFLKGNIACAEGALAAGCRFYAGYPITPASEIMAHMSKRILEENGAFIQTEDEISAISAVIGASWGGMKAMTATSGPGISLMLENIGLAVATETPCVIVNVQRGGPSTGSPSLHSQADVLQAKFGSHGDYPMIAIAPSSPQEMFDHTVWAFNKSEKYRTPVFVLSDRLVSHMTEQVHVPSADEVFVENRKILGSFEGKRQKVFLGKDSVAPMPVFGRGLKANVTGSTHLEDGFRDVSSATVLDSQIKLLHEKIASNAADIVLVDEDYTDDAEVVFFSYGSTYRSVLEGVERAREKGMKAGSFRAVTLWPFPEKSVQDLAERVKKIVVCENNLGQMYPFVKAAIGTGADVEFLAPEILGTLIKPEKVVEKIREVLG
jgi:2-oxoglutarate ferredoxin oxidoreductase subunit alpha